MNYNQDTNLFVSICVGLKRPTAQVAAQQITLLTNSFKHNYTYDTYAN